MQTDSQELKHSGSILGWHQKSTKTPEICIIKISYAFTGRKEYLEKYLFSFQIRGEDQISYIQIFKSTLI